MPCDCRLFCIDPKVSTTHVMPPFFTGVLIIIHSQKAGVYWITWSILLLDSHKVSHWWFMFIAWKGKRYACLIALRWSMLMTYYAITPVIKCINSQALENVIAMEATECILYVNAHHFFSEIDYFGLIMHHNPGLVCTTSISYTLIINDAN